MKNTLKSATLLFLFTCLLTVGCDRSPSSNAVGTFADQPGEYWVGGDHLGTFTVVTDPDGHHLELDQPAYPGSTVVMSNYLKEGWFIYVETSDRLWLWTGEALERGLFTEEAQVFDSALGTRGVKEEIPPEVLVRLPESLKETLAVEPPEAPSKAN